MSGMGAMPDESLEMDAIATALALAIVFVVLAITAGMFLSVAVW
jgi:hypothetical protein